MIAVLCLSLAACSGANTPAAPSVNPAAAAAVTPASQPTAGSGPVAANFQGHWMGDFQVTACAGGPYVSTTNLCDGQFAVGSWIPVNMVLYQGPDRVTGVLTLTAASQVSGVFSNNFTGSVGGFFDGSGNVHLEGGLEGANAERNGRSFRVTVRDWTAAMSGDLLVSTWTLDFRQEGVSGNGIVVATTPGLVRVQ
jgi:hypothetical protein